MRRACHRKMCVFDSFRQLPSLCVEVSGYQFEWILIFLSLGFWSPSSFDGTEYGRPRNPLVSLSHTKVALRLQTGTAATYREPTRKKSAATGRTVMLRPPEAFTSGRLRTTHPSFPVDRFHERRLEAGGCFGIFQTLSNIVRIPFFVLCFFRTSSRIFSVTLHKRPRKKQQEMLEIRRKY